MSQPTVPTPAPPDWLADLANRLADRIEPIDEFAEVGCHYCPAGAFWELSLFLIPGEELGGPRDGRRLFQRFQFELRGLIELFDHVEDFYWQPLAIDRTDEVGPHVAIIGDVGGRRVWVRVLAEPSERFDE